MRAVFLFVVVGSASLAFATKPVTPNAPAERVTTVDPVTGLATTTETTRLTAPTESDGAKAAKGKTTISLTTNSVIIGYGDGEPLLHIAPGVKAVIVCNTFTFSNAHRDKPTVHCQQCEFTLPNGSTGEAADVMYDTTTKMLTLTGTDDQPVKLASNRDGGGQRIKAPKMEIELDFSAQVGFPIPTRAYIEAGDPFAPATTVTPNPIHRTDKALIAD